MGDVTQRVDLGTLSVRVSSIEKNLDKLEEKFDKEDEKREDLGIEVAKVSTKVLVYSGILAAAGTIAGGFIIWLIQSKVG